MPVTHNHTTTIPDWTEADVTRQIAAGNLPQGTTLADIITGAVYVDPDHHTVSVNVDEINATGTPDATTYLRGDGTWTAIGGSEQTLTDGATINWDVSLGSIASVTLAGNRAMAAPTNASSGDNLTLYVTQDTTGSRTLTWDTSFRFSGHTSPTLTTTAQYSDLFEFKYNGTYFIESNKKQGFKLYEDPPPPPSMIQSIQYATITIAGASTTGTATISSVTEANTLLILNGSGSEDSSDPRGAFARIALTNATTITATRGIASGSPCVVRICVVEFAAGVITSKESGTKTFGTTTSTATLATAVNTSLAVVIPQGFTASGIPDSYGWIPAMSLTGTNTVTFYLPNNLSNVTVGYTVIELDATNIQSIQNVNSLISGQTTTSSDVTISSVTTANTLVIPGGCANGQSGDWLDGAHVMTLTGSTTLQVLRTGTTSINNRVCAAVIEFVSGVVNSRQAGSLSSNATSQTATITAVDTTKTATIFSGLRTNVTTSNLQNSTGSVALTASTTVTTYKPAAGGTSFMGYQVIEFV